MLIRVVRNYRTTPVVVAAVAKDSCHLGMWAARGRMTEDIAFFVW